MIRPERRTRADLVAVALIVVALLVGGAVAWWNSDVRATVSQPAPQRAAEPAGPASVPASLSEAWRAASPATPGPVAAGPSVVTAAGGEVLGHDPDTGAVRWRYSRDIPLCTVGAEWTRALAVYRKSSGCSEVTSIRGTTGARGPQHNSDIGFGARLVSDGNYLTALSRGMVETWRSDLVRTQQYGVPVAPKNPDNNLKRPHCTYSSAAAGDERVGVIEQCPGDPGDRVTVVKAHPQDDEKPDETLSTVTGSRDAQAVGVSDSRVAVTLPGQSQLVTYNSKGSVQLQTPIRTGPNAAPTGAEQVVGVRFDPRQSADPARTAQWLAGTIAQVDPTVTAQSVLAAADRNEPVAQLPTRTYGQIKQKLAQVTGVTVSRMLLWNTGRDTVALDATQLTPLWTIPDTLGNGTMFGGKLVIPTTRGLSVHNPNTGAPERTIPLDRQGYTGPISLSSVGQVLIEKRGDTIVALR